MTLSGRPPSRAESRASVNRAVTVSVLPRLTKLRALELIQGNKLGEEDLVKAAIRAAAAELPQLKELQ